jgi:N-acyl-D-aspartate/D-glutamate deacylase
MGERAFAEEATSEDLAAMKRELRSALRAGAAGFTSSRSRAHQTPDGRPVASRLATWDELKQLVGVMGEMRAGAFEIAREDIDRDPERMRDYITRLETLALDTGVPITFGLTHSRKAPQTWRPLFQMVDETNAAGGKMLVQGHSRSISVLLSFETTTPFDKAPVWCDIRKLPLAEQEAALRNPDMRRKMVEAAHERIRSGGQTVGAEPRRPEFDWIFVLDKPLPPYRSVGEIGREQNKDPVEAMIDLALEKHLKQFFQHRWSMKTRIMCSPRCGIRAPWSPFRTRVHTFPKSWIPLFRRIC